jgi:hypothetical protein
MTPITRTQGITNHSLDCTVETGLVAAPRAVPLPTGPSVQEGLRKGPTPPVCLSVCLSVKCLIRDNDNSSECAGSLCELFVMLAFAKHVPGRSIGYIRPYPCSRRRGR